MTRPVARQLRLGAFPFSVGHLSGGRAGWNVVTSGTDAEAANFGLPHQRAHSERYARAAEHITVVTALWDSWDDDPLALDKGTGRFFDHAKVRAIDHDGAFYQVHRHHVAPPSRLDSPAARELFPLEQQA
jgi:alkanesulfonate monooxygenase SsuD/methylene tetrahydromethanopterin reductase-like flavin-dependent oxidoreductase (luciferase family)